MRRKVRSQVMPSLQIIREPSAAGLDDRDLSDRKSDRSQLQFRFPSLVLPALKLFGTMLAERGRGPVGRNRAAPRLPKAAPVAAIVAVARLRPLKAGKGPSPAHCDHNA